MTYSWHDLLGNLGVATILGTYLAVQLGRLAATSAAYCAANALGAALVLVSLSVAFNLSAVLVEGAWLAISLVGLARVLVLRRRGASRRWAVLRGHKDH